MAPCLLSIWAGKLELKVHQLYGRIDNSEEKVFREKYMLLKGFLKI